MQSFSHEMEDLLDLSRDLSVAIADDNRPLEEVEARLVERDARIRGLFSQPQDASLRVPIQDWIGKIQALDAEALQHLRARRQRMADSLLQLRHGIEVTSLYEDTNDLDEG